MVWVREGSMWIEDPEHVEIRQRKAHSMIIHADIHEFRAHPDAPAEGEDDSEEEARAKEAMYKYANNDPDFLDEEYDDEADEEEVEDAEAEDAEDGEGSEAMDEEIVVDADLRLPLQPKLRPRQLLNPQ